MSDINGKVKQWLEKSGYPLEMEIAKALQSAGFSVVQSEYFQDTESQKWRETDVVAYEECRGKTCRSVLSIVVECKGDTSKPWVLFAYDDNYPQELSVIRRASNKSGESILRSLAFIGDACKGPLFDVPKRPAYSVAVALKDGNSDIAFRALNSVCRASIGLISRLNNVSGEKIIPFAWPVIVINAPLFEAFLDKEGDLQVEQIEKGLLIWKNPVIGEHTIVQIYTKNKLVDEAKDLKFGAEKFLKLVNEENDRSPRKEIDC